MFMRLFMVVCGVVMAGIELVAEIRVQVSQLWCLSEVPTGIPLFLTMMVDLLLFPVGGENRILILHADRVLRSCDTPFYLLLRFLIRSPRLKYISSSSIEASLKTTPAPL